MGHYEWILCIRYIYIHTHTYVVHVLRKNVCCRHYYQREPDAGEKYYL